MDTAIETKLDMISLRTDTIVIAYEPRQSFLNAVITRQRRHEQPRIRIDSYLQYTSVVCCCYTTVKLRCLGKDI
jgi:archaellum biogenesis ATPase FlaH